jgi:hypothetical protein
MKRTFMLAFSVLFLVNVCFVNATPSTQIWIPSTDVQPFLKPHLGWDVYLNPYGSGLLSNGGITIGVLPFNKIGGRIL